MVMGLDKTKKFLALHPELNAYIIYSDATGKLSTWSSDGLSQLIEAAPSEVK